MAMIIAKITMAIFNTFSMTFLRWMAAKLFCLNELDPSFL